MGPERVAKFGTRKGEKVVMIMDKTWASKWARKSGHDRAHHRHKKEL